ncbi:MAG: hypothetical protein C5B49_02050 [Bdellovibrio sp.]|nr:MAG: hypothetical protein C5B49_02050 [Bdellovibrio sp.]
MGLYSWFVLKNHGWGFWRYSRGLSPSYFLFSVAILPACGVGFVAALCLQGCSKFVVDTPESSSFATFSDKSCGSFSPAHTNLRLLSRAEYDNIALDVFGSSIVPSVQAGFDVIPTGDTGFTNSGMTSVPTAPQITDTMTAEYWKAAELLASEVIQKKSGTASFYSQVAACALTTPITTDCYSTILTNLSLRIWRRLINTSSANNEAGRLMAIFSGQSTFDSGLHDVIKAMLMSPNFLMLSYTQGGFTPNSVFPIDQFQMASRLSFFIWLSAPDQTLLNLAAQNQLSDSATLQAQVHRMLADPKGLRLGKLLADEWVNVSDLPNLGFITPSTAIQNDLVTETELFMQNIVSSDLNIMEMFTGKYSFLNANLAAYYQVSSPSNATGFQRTSLASTPRMGVFTQAAFAMVTAGSPTTTHPVYRGKAMALHFACQHVAEPPAGIAASFPTNIPSGISPKQTLAYHTANPVCAACHNVIDPYGLALENFDSFGNYRTSYANLNNIAVDPSGTLPTGESFQTADDFLQVLSQDPATQACMVQNLMALAVTRTPTSSDDKCVTSTISKTAVLPATSKFSDIILAIVNSREFLLQTSEAQ